MFKKLLRELIEHLFPSQVAERKAVIYSEHKDRIIGLANELCTAIQDSGKSFAHPSVSEGWGSISVYINDFGSENSVIGINDLLNGWSFCGKPTFENLVLPDETRD